MKERDESWRGNVGRTVRERGKGARAKGGGGKRNRNSSS